MTRRRGGAEKDAEKAEEREGQNLRARSQRRFVGFARGVLEECERLGCAGLERDDDGRRGFDQLEDALEFFFL